MQHQMQAKSQMGSTRNLFGFMFFVTVSDQFQVKTFML